MKKAIIFLLIIAAAYWGYKNYGSQLFGSGELDEQGKPKVILFTADGCGPCEDLAADLRSRNILFEEVNVATEEGATRIAKLGVRQLPLIVIGGKTFVCGDAPALEAALAEARGTDSLSPAVQQVMKNHFDEQGKPLVVMYGTETCPYCNRMRAYMDAHKIPYSFVDVSSPGSSGRADFDTLRGRGYPLIFVGYRRIDGYSEDKLNQAVKDLL